MTIRPVATFALSLPIAVLLASQAAPLSAQNLLANPSFDTSLDGWQIAGPLTTVSWDGTTDAEGSAFSGSARAVWQAPTVTGLYAGLSQCVEVTAGVTYRFGGKVFIPSGQATTASAFFIALPFLDHGCSGPVPPHAFAETPAVTSFDRWIRTTATINPFGPSVLISTYLAPNTGGAFQASYDDIILEPDTGNSGNCALDAYTLCLGSGRFSVTASFDAGNGNSGQAHALESGDSGLLWFFSSSNIEAVVKLLDGCASGGHFWFFAAGLTNIGVTLTVTDAQTGAVKTYSNPLGRPFAPIQDTSAFPCS